MSNKDKAGHTEKVCAEVIKHQIIGHKKSNVQLEIIRDLKAKIWKAQEMIYSYEQEYTEAKVAICDREGVSLKFIERIVTGRAEKLEEEEAEDVESI